MWALNAGVSGDQGWSGNAMFKLGDVCYKIETVLYSANSIRFYFRHFSVLINTYVYIKPYI